ncbi:phospho-sugar mutase [Corynebacterium sp. YIM 101645]|uniref:Phospho-sugar mutase n=1 Tax=Corynebacterium lemuris TaxID=1859292 RepID=A0ABT2FXQ7_9CORY|nr:phospho-sugar mutase [Corynebacterium lemuris]MCS5479283.1 phospho-sugar mutase [Corynebacterium lemuris]
MDPAQWAAHDPDPATRAEVLGWLAEESPQLVDRFVGPLLFGTAGIRGPVGAGESAMNIATVTRTTAGLAAWLGPGTRVVLGCDARHGSADFRQVTAEVLSAAGIRVLLLPAQLPTPVTAFALRHLGADAAVMITASHNPAGDNGYKVYDCSGSQIIPPADMRIAAAIEAVGWADEVPRSTDNIEQVDVLEEYLTRAATLVDAPVHDLPIVVTALHGVGGGVLAEALARAGFRDVHPVVEQHRPDPDFPTVRFPNPEEPGALDLAYATADRVGARLILAVDPDADRCSVAVPGESGWRRLSGDEVGALLGWEIAARTERGVLASSIVSSRLLGRIAAHHGLAHETTLTGFKWIARVPGLVYGYEEALGYCTDPRAVADKDGITACLRVAELASRANLEDLLAEIAGHFGWYLTAPLTLRTTQAPELLARLVAAPPTVIGAAPVTRVVDLSAGYGGLPPTSGLLLATEADDRVIIRPSGTEPKLKCYLEVINDSRAAGQERLEVLRAELAELLRPRPGEEPAPSSG